MKTTIDLNDALLEAARDTALREGTTLRTVVETALRQYLDARATLSRAPFQLRRIFAPPTPVADALAQVECWREAPSLTILGETPAYWSTLRPLVERGQVQGGRVHDARIAAICLQHRIEELWSVNRDFSRFPMLRAFNPLLQPRN